MPLRIRPVRCMACHGPGEPLQAWSYEVAGETPPGQVDVEISHCGVCGSDIHQIDNTWGIASYPLVPGHEIIGTVIGKGPDVQHLNLGQRVGIGPQRSSCGSCASCHAGLEQTCPKITKTYAGPGKDKGGFARFIRYNSNWTFAIPESLPSELAAPLMCAGITTYWPLKRHCKAGMRVGVVGVGGLGHIAIQFAKALDCEVVAISKSPDKEQEALEFGASSLLCSEDQEQMRAAQMSLDLILNTASGLAGLDGYLSLLKPFGIMTCVGLPEKDEVRKTTFSMQALVKLERELKGSYLGPRGYYQEMLAFSAAHGIRPKVEVMKLEEVNEAVAKVKAGQARYRMVLAMRE